MNDRKPIIAPSILAADFTCLGSQIEACVKANVEWIHCDIMDGHFVPNISYGPAIVGAAARACNCFLDLHLMIEQPDQYITAFADAGANLVTVHQEACTHLHRTIQNIKNNKLKAGVAINPATSVSLLEPILADVDLVLVMSVNPGFGGQSFIENTHSKIQSLYRIRRENNFKYLIEVDGGVGPDNIAQIAKDGADVFVAGSSIFKSNDIGRRINQLHKKAEAATEHYI